MNMHSAEIRAVVLAAGAGTRLDPLTRRIPKPLAPVANRPAMEHILRLLKKHGINHVAANLYHKADRVPVYFDKVKDLDMTINYVTEEQLSGDAGGVRACRQHLGDSMFVVIMGDIITDIDLTYLLEQHKKSEAIVTIALKTVEDVKQFGVVALDDNGFIKQFQEKPNPSEAISNLASTGIYICEPEIFDYFPETGEFGFARQLFPKLLELGIPINGVEVYGYWSDIGTIPTYRQTCFDVIEGLVSLETSADIMEKDAAANRGMKLEGKLMLGQNVVLGDNITVKGHVVIGDNCMIGSGVTLEDCIVWADSTVAVNSQIKRAIIADGCHLRSFSRWADVVIAEAIPTTGNAPRVLGRSRSKAAFAS